MHKSVPILELKYGSLSLSIVVLIEYGRLSPPYPGVCVLLSCVFNVLFSRFAVDVLRMSVYTMNKRNSTFPQTESS